MPDVSVIIPVYNAEKYLRECLDSIKKQDCDFEAIIIDDGSLDSSSSICDEYAVSDSRFKVFHCENSGPANARNLGLSKAKGIWITFVDADDKIEPDYLKVCLSQEYKKADIIIANHSYLHGGNETPKHWPNAGEQINTSKGLNTLKLQTLNIYARNPAQKISSTWGKFYRRAIISKSNLGFPQNLTYYEDAIFMWKCISYSTNIFFATDVTPRYIYREVSNSLTHLTDDSIINRKILSYEYILEQLYTPTSAISIESFFLDQFYHLLKIILLSQPSLASIIRQIKALYKMPLYKVILRRGILEGLSKYKYQRLPYFFFKFRFTYLIATYRFLWK